MNKRTREDVVIERIKPKQARAFRTREVIFEAAARIIEEQGANALSTNAIAARAGVSIGTLYGHFTNKQAILVAMASRQLQCDEETILRVLSQSAQDTSRVRTVVRALINLHLTRPAVRRAIMAALRANGFADEVIAVVRRATERILLWRIAADRPGTDGTTMFFATRGVMGLLRATFDEEPALLSTAKFEDELTALAEGCFARAEVRSPDSLGESVQASEGVPSVSSTTRCPILTSRPL